MNNRRTPLVLRRAPWALGWALVVAGAGCDGTTQTEQIELVRSALTSGAVKINAGGGAQAPFIADVDFNGGSTITRNNSIDLSAVTNPAPTAVYQSQRFGNMTYTLPGFTTGSWNKVRLHFCDTHFTTAGSRMFNVSINGVQVLSSFDVVATVGAGNKALVESFTMPTNSSGQYVIQFSNIANKDQATISGIEVGPAPTSGTLSTASGTAYAKQCAQQLVPLPPSFGGSGDCATCLAGPGPCPLCTAGAWTYSGSYSQSFNEPAPVDFFFYQATGATPGLCMAAARQDIKTGAHPNAWTDFFGVICQAASGAVCYWDQAGQKTQPTHQFGWNMTRNHVVVPTTAKVIASTTTNPTAFVGGNDLISSSNVHFYQKPCADCHAGRNAFNNHPGTATDLFFRGLATAANWMPSAWPAPIVPSWDPGVGVIGGPWPANPGPGPKDPNQFPNTQCFNCHTDSSQIGGTFPAVSAQLPNYCEILLRGAVGRENAACPNTWPWSDGPPAPNIDCPTGAMPPSSLVTPPSAGDPFATGMLDDDKQCDAEYRTQWLAPPGAATALWNAPNTLSTISATFHTTGFTEAHATTFGVGPTGTVFQYDFDNPHWVSTNGNVTALSVGSDGSVWAIVNTTSGGFPVGYTCAATTGSCLPSGSCSWQCNWSAPNSFNWSQIAAGVGTQIWAVDSSRYLIYSQTSAGAGQYDGSPFFAMGEWPFGDPIKQLSVGGDGDVWVVSDLGNITEYSNNNFVARPSPPGTQVVSISVGSTYDVWAASSSGLFRWLPGTQTWERHCLTGGCNDNQHFTTVSVGAGSPREVSDIYYGIDVDVWALDSAGHAFRNDRNKGSTSTSIGQIGTTVLSRIAVGGQGDVWGLTSAGTVLTFQ